MMRHAPFAREWPGTLQGMRLAVLAATVLTAACQAPDVVPAVVSSDGAVCAPGEALCGVAVFAEPDGYCPNVTFCFDGGDGGYCPSRPQVACYLYVDQ
jgi:hypothetical protein